MGRKTLGGLDSETLTKMERFYEEVYLNKVAKLLEVTIIYHSNPTPRNLLDVEKSLQYCRENMIRMNVFATHNDVPKTIVP